MQLLCMGIYFPLWIIGFRRHSTTLQPVFQVHCRNTIKREIFKIYPEERSITLKLLDSLQGRVVTTSEMWTASNQKKGYMVVTAHYIDASWNLKSQILRYVKKIELFLYYC